MPIDLPTLAALFSATLSTDANVRTAEREVCMILASSPRSSTIAIRQSCVVFIKNRNQMTSYNPLGESDKEALCGSLVGLIASGIDRPLRLQLQSTLKSVLANDFPAAYPTFLPTITALLSARNMRDVRARAGVLEAVRVFHHVAGVLRWIGLVPGVTLPAAALALLAFHIRLHHASFGLASHLKVFLENEVSKGQLIMELKCSPVTQEKLAWPTDSNDLPVAFTSPLIICAHSSRCVGVGAVVSSAGDTAQFAAYLAA
ncbi:hypothetical protein BDZ89DRAFT_1154828 [Hymenopellis radicata]|nr:hypothetical protein BDZ89DRAFT_1154828 [Hymenopellis radicata]